MDKWKYKSLEWIHKVREENFEKTRNRPLSEIIKESVSETKKKSKDYI